MSGLVLETGLSWSSGVSDARRWIELGRSLKEAPRVPACWLSSHSLGGYIRLVDLLEGLAVHYAATCSELQRLVGDRWPALAPSAYSTLETELTAARTAKIPIADESVRRDLLSLEETWRLPAGSAPNLSLTFKSSPPHSAWRWTRSASAVRMRLPRSVNERDRAIGPRDRGSMSIPSQTFARLLPSWRGLFLNGRVGARRDPVLQPGHSEGRPSCAVAAVRVSTRRYQASEQRLPCRQTPAQELHPDKEGQPTGHKRGATGASLEEGR